MKLEQHLHHLPSHSMEDQLWDKIESQLEAEVSLADKLPNHKANPMLWDGIEQALLNKRTRLYLKLRYASIAASIAVIIAVGGILISQQENPSLYYSDELVIERVQMPEVKTQVTDVMENCTQYPAVCTTPDFTRLKNTLDQLKQKEQELRDLKSVSDDPKMEMYHSRIVKNIQQVEAQMLQLFI